MQYEIGQELQDSMGVNITSFDGDQADPRLFKAQYETKLLRVEMMDEKKAMKQEEETDAE